MPSTLSDPSRSATRVATWHIFAMRPDARVVGLAFGLATVSCGGRTGLLLPPELSSVDSGAIVPDAFDANGNDTITPPFDGASDVPFDSAIVDLGDDGLVDVGPSDAPLEPLELSLGDAHTCVRRADATVLCWGLAEFFGGVIGEVSPTPKTIDAFAGAKRIVVGTSQTCAVVSDGTAQCVGWRIGGRFSDPSGHSTSPLTIAGLDDVAEIALGGNASCTYACARRNDGAVLCWGCNSFGMLGDGTTTDRATPLLVAGLSDVAQIAAKPSSLHTCARMRDGTAMCWGLNEGQIGDGTTTSRATPTSVMDLTSVAEIAAGYATSFARQIDGTTLGWGFGTMGELGIGKTDTQLTPMIVPSITAARIDVGMYHACALLTDSSLACWGSNGAGQLGDGTTTERDTPVIVYGKGVIDVALGTAHTCARLGDGSLWCWGSNTSGNLGDGVTPLTRSSPTPVRVKGF
jgi:alpha-tubulin suppressor-like RCC1 family protein